MLRTPTLTTICLSCLKTALSLNISVKVCFSSIAEPQPKNYSKRIHRHLESTARACKRTLSKLETVQALLDSPELKELMGQKQKARFITARTQGFFHLTTTLERSLSQLNQYLASRQAPVADLKGNKDKPADSPEYPPFDLS
jgi:hypothetical protein